MHRGLCFLPLRMHAGASHRADRRAAAAVNPVSFVETVVWTAWETVTYPKTVLETVVETVVKPVTSVETVVFM